MGDTVDGGENRPTMLMLVLHGKKLFTFSWTMTHEIVNNEIPHGMKVHQTTKAWTFMVSWTLCSWNHAMLWSCLRNHNTCSWKHEIFTTITWTNFTNSWTSSWFNELFFSQNHAYLFTKTWTDFFPCRGFKLVCDLQWKKRFLASI